MKNKTKNMENEKYDFGLDDSDLRVLDLMEMKTKYVRSDWNKNNQII